MPKNLDPNDPKWKKENRDPKDRGASQPQHPGQPRADDAQEVADEPRRKDITES